MNWAKHFRRHSVEDLMEAELDALEELRYKEDQRRDHHASLVEGYTKRIEKLKYQLNQTRVCA